VHAVVAADENKVRAETRLLIRNRQATPANDT
jgi:hypothetical protein